jgi:hypothetical protein
MGAPLIRWRTADVNHRLIELKVCAKSSAVEGAQPVEVETRDCQMGSQTAGFLPRCNRASEAVTRRTYREPVRDPSRESLGTNALGDRSCKPADVVSLCVIGETSLGRESDNREPSEDQSPSARTTFGGRRRVTLSGW